MTRQADFPKKMTAFSAWIRDACMNSHDGLAVTNLDFILRRWDDPSDKRMMLVEEKTYGGLLNPSQMLTFKILNDALITYCTEDRIVTYLGFYLIRFSHTSPEDSDWIEINGVPVSPKKLAEHLNMTQLHADAAGYGKSYWKDLAESK